MNSKFTRGLACLLVASGLFAAPKPPKETTLVLPKLVVKGSRMPSGWMEISWECRGPFPIDRIKRAWISKVLADGPPGKAGIKVGDLLLAIGNVPVETMTGIGLEADLKRERRAGTQEEFSILTPGGEKRTVVVVYENEK